MSNGNKFFWLRYIQLELSFFLTRSFLKCMHKIISLNRYLLIFSGVFNRKEFFWLCCILLTYSIFWSIIFCAMYIQKNIKWIFCWNFLRCLTKINCSDYIVFHWLDFFLNEKVLCNVRTKIVNENIFWKGMYGFGLFSGASISCCFPGVCPNFFQILWFKNAPRKYVLSYTYVRYLCITLGQKYEFLLLYIPILGLTKIFYFT